MQQYAQHSLLPGPQQQHKTSPLDLRVAGEASIEGSHGLSAIFSFLFFV